MAKPAITFRSVKGEALSYSELDTNFQNLKDATFGVTVGANTATVDLNSALTLVAGSNITLTLNTSTDTLTIASTGGSAGEFEDIYVDDSIIGPEYVDDSGVQPRLDIISSQYSGLIGAPSKIRLLGSVSNEDSGVKTSPVVISAGRVLSGSVTYANTTFDYNLTTSESDLLVLGNITASSSGTIQAGTLSASSLYRYASGYPTGTPSNTATPAGYLLVEVGGSNRYIPYYQ